MFFHDKAKQNDRQHHNFPACLIHGPCLSIGLDAIPLRLMSWKDIKLSIKYIFFLQNITFRLYLTNHLT